MRDTDRWELELFPRPHSPHAVTVTASAAARLITAGTDDFAAWDRELLAAGSPL
jgi:hypothetical protein